MRKLSILTISLLLPFMMFSQNNEMRHKINFALLQAIDEYENLLNLNEDKFPDFINQFESPSVPVYNDLLGISYANTLSAQEYGDLLLNSENLFRVNIIKVKRGEIISTPDGFEVSAQFEKNIEYTDERGALYSASEFYGKFHEITIRFIYNEEKDKCLIRDISGKVDSDKKLPENHIVIKRDLTGKKDSIIYSVIKYNGKPLSFNRVNQTFLPGDVTFGSIDDDINASDMDILVYTTPTQTGLTKLNAKYKRMRFSLNFGMNLGNSITVDNKNDYSSVYSSSYQYGVEMGYMFPSPGKTKIGLSFGAGMNSSWIRYTKGETQISISEQTDYTTIEQLSYQNQEITFTDIPVHLGLSVMNFITEKIAINFDLKVRAYMAQKAELGKYNFTYTLFDRFVEGGENYDSIQETKKYSADSYSNTEWSLEPGSLPITITALAGGSYMVTPYFYAGARIGYELGITDYFTFTNTVQGGIDKATSKGEAPLITSCTAKKSAPWAEIVLTFKF